MSRLTLYSTIFDEYKRPELIREKSWNYGNTVCDSPERVVEIMQSIFSCGSRCEEHVWMLCLDGSRKIVGAVEVSKGTLTSSLVHPREVFITAIGLAAASIILVHNHPSGSLDASPMDNEVTKRIKNAGELIGIFLDDHILVGGNDWTSIML